VAVLVLLLVGLVFSAAAVAGVVRVEGESIPSGAFSGNWIVYGGEPGLSAGQGIYSNTANDTLTYAFTGTEIAWIGVYAPTCGQADVWVDGQTPVAVNLYISTPAEYGKTIWSKQGLSAGNHTLHIRVHGTGNINVDALDITTPDPVVSTPASSPWSIALAVAFAGAIGAVALRRKHA
jgi:hypothetical protein